jgi:hypothetical protein
MAINFPTSPSLNAIHTESGLSWKYNGNAWLSVATGNTESVVATGSTQPRSLSDRFADVVNVKDFGAVGDGTTDDTAAFQAAANKAGVGKPIYVPSGNYNKSTITNEGNYFWICDEALDASGTNPISLTGHVEQAFNNRRLITKTAAGASEYSEVQLSKTFNYNGGTSGNVSSNLIVTADVSTGVNDFVWGIVSVLNNSANAGENVAMYGQGNRIGGVGAVWAGVFEARDKTNTDGTGKSGTVGIEVDVFANGLAPSDNRVGVDIVCGKGVASGETCQTSFGLRIAPQDSSTSNGTYKFGVKTLGCTSADILAASESYAAVQASGTNTYGVLLSGTHTVGFDTSTSTIVNNAIRIAANQTIALDATATITLEYDTTSDSILLKKGGATKHTFLMT